MVVCTKFVIIQNSKTTLYAIVIRISVEYITIFTLQDTTRLNRYSDHNYIKVCRSCKQFTRAIHQNINQDFKALYKAQISFYNILIQVPGKTFYMQTARIDRMRVLKPLF